MSLLLVGSSIVDTYIRFAWYSAYPCARLELSQGTQHCWLSLHEDRLLKGIGVDRFRLVFFDRSWLREAQ